MRRYETEEEYNIRDGVRAVVTGVCKNGLFLCLENGQAAFAYFSPLELYTEVYCTVKRKPSGRRDALVVIDSVVYKKGYAA